MPRRAALQVLPLSRTDAEAIARWRYSGPYAQYNAADGGERQAVAYMLDARNGFHAVRGSLGLYGFCSFGADGRVPGGPYDEDALDIGAGMDPALVGRGHGRAFTTAIVAHATLRMHARKLRVTIGTWNERALRVWSNLGFGPVATFQSFTILTRSEIPGPRK
jgi:RimJ/RimL family protein N-acetyltransferase